MENRRRNPLVVALALLAAGCANYMKVEVEGRVVDEAGHPVAGVQVTTAPWPEGTVSPSPRSYVLTDLDGRFSATLPRATGPEQALFANVPNDNRGGFVVLPGDRASGLQIILQPLTTVRAEIDSASIPPAFRIMGPSVNAVSREPRPTIVGGLFGRGPGSGAVSFRLPPGTYELHANGGGKPLVRAFEVSAAGAEIDLGKLSLEPYKYQTLTGRPAPDLYFADARGVSKSFRLADLRGKWVLLFFWNHRMEYNRQMLESLSEFYAAAGKMRDRFEILVIHHSDDVLTVRDLDMALWHQDVRMPMPVIIDDQEKTFYAYGLERGPMFRSSPWEFLVDPEGRIVSHGFMAFSHLVLNLLEKKPSEK